MSIVPSQETSFGSPPKKGSLSYFWQRAMHYHRIIGILSLVWIIGIIFFFILGVGAILVKRYFIEEKVPSVQVIPTLAPTAVPAADQTVSWKTYTGEGYLIKYPSEDHFQAKQKVGSEELIYFADQNGRRAEVFKIIISREKTDKKDIYGLGEEYGMMKYVKLGSNDALRFLSDTVPPDPTTYYSLINDGVLYHLAVLPFDQDGVALLDIDQILSTFKFLDEGQVTSSSDQLLAVTFSGGLCPDGKVCSSTNIIKRDGLYLVDGKAKTTLSNTELTRLVNLISITDFDKLKLKKFQGICPTAYDGQEVVYTFYTSNGTEMISSCQVEIDYQSPLFSAIEQVLNKNP